MKCVTLNLENCSSKIVLCTSLHVLCKSSGPLQILSTCPHVLCKLSGPLQILSTCPHVLCKLSGPLQVLSTCPHVLCTCCKVLQYTLLPQENWSRDKTCYWLESHGFALISLLFINQERLLFSPQPVQALQGWAGLTGLTAGISAGASIYHFSLALSALCSLHLHNLKGFCCSFGHTFRSFGHTSLRILYNEKRY